MLQLGSITKLCSIFTSAIIIEQLLGYDRHFRFNNDSVVSRIHYSCTLWFWIIVQDQIIVLSQVALQMRGSWRHTLYLVRELYLTLLFRCSDVMESSEQSITLYVPRFWHLSFSHFKIGMTTWGSRRASGRLRGECRSQCSALQTRYTAFLLREPPHTTPDRGEQKRPRLLKTMTCFVKGFDDGSLVRKDSWSMSVFLLI